MILIQSLQNAKEKIILLLKRLMFISTVDIIISVALLLYAMGGWHKGALRTLSRPIGFILGIGLGLFYLSISHNLLKSVAIMIFGPIIISFILLKGIALWHQRRDRGMPPSLTSKLIGMSLNFLWGGLTIAIILIFIMLIPSRNPTVTAIQIAIESSYAYSHITETIGNRIPFVSQMHTIFNATQNPSALKALSQTEEFQQMQKNPKFRHLLANKALSQQLRQQDIVSLLKNPEFRDLLQDKEFVYQLLKLYQKIQTENLLKAPRGLTFSNSAEEEKH